MPVPPFRFEVPLFRFPVLLFRFKYPHVDSRCSYFEYRYRPRGCRPARCAAMRALQHNARVRCTHCNKSRCNAHGTLSRTTRYPTRHGVSHHMVPRMTRYPVCHGRCRTSMSVGSSPSSPYMNCTMPPVDDRTVWSYLSRAQPRCGRSAMPSMASPGTTWRGAMPSTASPGADVVALCR